MKRLLFSISVGIIAALVFIAVYNYIFHPEIAYFRNADNISTKWENNLRSNGEPCYILGGGSEIRSSLSPAIMLKEYNLHAVNAASAAGFGLVVNTAIALNHIQKGDTLVLSIISASDRNTMATENGVKLAVQLSGLSAYTRSGITPAYDTISSLFASDIHSVIVTIARKLTRGYSFAYEKEATIHADGWMEIHRRGMENAAIPHLIAQDKLPGPACIELLTRTQKTCREIGAQFIVMLPAGFNNEYETARRLLQALHITRMGIPVLRDERLGRMQERAKLADTYYHMNAEGTRENSCIIAKLLKEKSYWSEEELVKRLRALGLADDGTPLP